ncbi:hypothetical protein VTO73DRAFT_1209 [Trametes versicolor]
MMAPRFVYRLLAFVISALPVRIRIKLWWRLLRAGKQRWQSESTTQRIPGGMYIKYSTLGRPVEAEATRFVGTHTSIPVPVIVDCFPAENKIWIVMSRLPGDALEAYYDEITPDVEQHLARQLAPLLASLRAIPPPSSAVCGFDQGPCHCERMAMDAIPLGPFEDIDAFHQSLLDRAGMRIPDGVDAALVHETIRRAHTRPHRLCLTHNDLGPHNILVDEDWNITGIVDWETCAWLPEYWELTKGTYLWQFRNGPWERIMLSVFQDYAEERKAEKYILQYRRFYG